MGNANVFSITEIQRNNENNLSNFSSLQGHSINLIHFEIDYMGTSSNSSLTYITLIEHYTLIQVYFPSSVVKTIV